MTRIFCLPTHDGAPFDEYGVSCLVSVLPASYAFSVSNTLVGQPSWLPVLQASLPEVLDWRQDAARTGRQGCLPYANAPGPPPPRRQDMLSCLNQPGRYHFPTMLNFRRVAAQWKGLFLSLLAVICVPV